MKSLNENLISECRRQLIETRAELLNRIRSAHRDFCARDVSAGDEVDQSVSVLEEHAFLVNQERMRFQLLEIEHALGRMEIGTYGICEETEEPIEPERLKMIPWTRLSIEGAEIREQILKQKVT